MAVRISPPLNCKPVKLSRFLTRSLFAMAKRHYPFSYGKARTKGETDEELFASIRFRTFGNAVQQLDSEDEEPSSYGRSAKRDDAVYDDQGRKRFHGAFTGGFTAGYHNTVGSKEGWAPQQFRSERTQKSTVQQTISNFMDEEDLEHTFSGSIPSNSREAHTEGAHYGERFWAKLASIFGESVTRSAHSDGYADAIRTLTQTHPSVLLDYGSRQGLGFIESSRARSNSVSNLRAVLSETDPSKTKEKKISMRSKFVDVYHDDYMAFEEDNDDGHIPGAKPIDAPTVLESSLQAQEELTDPSLLYDGGERVDLLLGLDFPTVSVPLDYELPGLVLKTRADSSARALAGSRSLKARYLLKEGLFPQEYTGEKLLKFKEFLRSLEEKLFERVDRPSLGSVHSEDDTSLIEYIAVLDRFQPLHSAINDRFTTPSQPVDEQHRVQNSVMRLPVRSIEKWTPSKKLLKRLE